MDSESMPQAYYDGTGPAVVIRDLAVRDQAVVAESRRWSTGRRGNAVGDDDMAGRDVSSFVTQALVVGAHAIGAAGGAQDTFNLERLISDVGTRTAASTSEAVGSTTEAMNRASQAMQQASSDARDAITDAGRTARQSFAENVTAAGKTLLDEVNRLVGGDNPELALRIAPMLERFGHDLDTRAAQQTSGLFAHAAKQFDPHDPASPMAKHARELAQHQEKLSTALDRNHRELAAKMEELTTAMKVSTSAREAAATTAGVTPLKGQSYAAGIHTVMEQIAAGLGDEYVDTGTLTGQLPRNKKGDAVLTVDGGAARVVLEMTDSKRPDWNGYLDQAERNRGAAAALGLVRDPAQNNGSTVRCLGARRIVVAFDPETDDPELLRTVVQLLRLSAVAASLPQDRDELCAADEKITEALRMLTKVDEIRKWAGSLRTTVGKIEQQSDDLRTALARLLTQAQSALSGADAGAGSAA